MSRRTAGRSTSRPAADLPAFAPREPHARGAGWPPWDVCWTPYEIRIDAILYARRYRLPGGCEAAERLAEEWMTANPGAVGRPRADPPGAF